MIQKHEEIINTLHSRKVEYPEHVTRLKYSLLQNWENETKWGRISWFKNLRNLFELETSVWAAIVLD